ncbi:MAG: N-6 DNA methylase [Actinobacteria bacterium]|nr:N-6 DNA methylase [Actinomycetota bacterium]
MLNAETKRKIQGLRDTLVGKIPVPTDQVKQITLGLIYKFMSDIDRENTDILGGKSFFNGDYGRYSWNNIIDKSLSSYERVTLYSEGLEKMSLNPNIPELFRDIFRNAYLPFRDPATLSQFLIGINEFNYDHSEDLGDAFEFLLSVMGSQGDAGQFRTPRHIIDFIVKVVEPKKTDRILDPACGTAGFLISAYKYILENNKTSDSDKSGSALSLTEKNKLTENFVGYDISTDMVRLSLVNMYLHNFANPNIKEYDTLTSEDLWDEDFDCIMANPPFMTPKGGIRPHKRFAIQAKRSELLFVDYIMEHLTPNGKAGVIVPEGIIYQSSKAYINLRKMLLDNGLYSVVSLPSGVFQPYSGVKTNILFIDKNISTIKNSVLFVDVKNTGISLGSTNIKIKENDLPEAKVVLESFKNSKEIESHISWKATREIIKKNDYNLSCLRYKPVILNSNEIKTYTFKDFSEIKKGKSSSTKTTPGEYPLYLTADKQKTADHFDFDGDGIAIPLISALGHGKAAIKRIHRVNGKFALANLLAFINPDPCIANPDFLYYLLDHMKNDIAKLMKGAANVSMKINDLESFVVPLPLIEIQKVTVEEINDYQKIIDGAKQVVKNYKPEIEINPNWKTVELCNQEFFYIESGGTPDSNKNEYWNGVIPWTTLIDLPSENFVTYISDTVRKISSKGLKNSSAKIIPKDSVLISTRATIGRVAINLIELATNQGFKNIIIKNKSKINYKYLAFIMTKKIGEMLTLASGGTFKEISKTNLGRIKIPLPSVNEQNIIALKIVEELNLIESNKKLIEIFEQKIKNKISTIWKK